MNRSIQPKSTEKKALWKALRMYLTRVRPDLTWGGDEGALGAQKGVDVGLMCLACSHLRMNMIKCGVGDYILN